MTKEGKRGRVMTTRESALEELYHGREEFLASSPDDPSLYQEADEKHEEAIQRILGDL